MTPNPRPDSADLDNLGSDDPADNATCEFCGTVDETVKQIDPNDRDQPYLLGRGVIRRMACSTCYEREVREAIAAAQGS